ncbi:MAG: hypothetical protein QF822_02805 [Candidatus Poseidoniia archaeon]|nr:hypothetical protein [Euryarchaeota archaeon]MDP6489446.1 hypothetical protein [Candidatus Poseidoniia archaeon]MDP6534136.1 hypothetical protein [Candidatus Poseidoniia archaeon]MDP6835346.1 hypothetical protein [Candidatus Poseidoniia archaeon]MEC9354392.1 hypothetical protein [Candidatus Thermoplasmatota archaeon]
MSLVENHLLFHKAIVGGDTERVDGYLELAQASEAGAEITAIEDPLARSIAVLFQLVREHELDPWQLDLGLVLQEYQNHALRAGALDLPLAGAILGWAWDVLRLRSAGAVEASEPLPEPEAEWAPFDFGWEPTYAEQLDMAAEPPLEETVRFRGERRVTLMELVGALEDARQVELARRARLERRKQLREARQTVLDDRASHLADKIHNDDPTLYKEQVWQKINTLNGKPIPLGDLVDVPERASLVRTFVGSLFLAREGRIDIQQKDLRSHSIYVRNREAAG